MANRSKYFTFHFELLTIVLLVIILCSCVKQPVVPDSIKGVIKQNQRLKVHASYPPWTSSDIIVKPGDRVLILVSGKVKTHDAYQFARRRLYLKIGKQGFPKKIIGSNNRATFISNETGKLMFCIEDWSYLNSYGEPVWHSKRIGKKSNDFFELGKYWYRDNAGSFQVDIFNFATSNEYQITQALNSMLALNQTDGTLHTQIQDILGQNEFQKTQISWDNKETSARDNKKQKDDVQINDLSSTNAAEKKDINILTKPFVQPGNNNRITCVASTPDGNYVLSADIDGKLRLWEISTGRQVRVFNGHTSIIFSIAIGHNGKYAASTSDDNTIRIWNIKTGKQINIFSGFNSPSHFLSFCENDDKIMAVFPDNTIRQWETETGKQTKSFRVNTSLITSFSVSTDGRYIIFGCLDNTVRLREIKFLGRKKPFKGHDKRIDSVALSPDGKYAVSGGADRTIRLWEIETGKNIKTFKGHTSPVKSISFSSDSRYLLSGSRDHSVRLWEIGTGNVIRIFKGHTDGVTSISFACNNKYIVSGSDDSTLRLWNIKTGRQIRIFEGHKNPVSSVAFNPDGSHIISGNNDATLSLWGILESKEIKNFKGHSAPVSSVAFSPDGDFIISGSWDKTLRLWKTEEGRNIHVLKGHNERVNTIACGPDGRYVISGSDDNTIRMWDLEVGASIEVMRGHSAAVSSVAFNPNGKQILSVSDDKTLRFWNIPSGMNNITIDFMSFYGKWNWSDITSSVFSPDGKYVFASGYVYAPGYGFTQGIYNNFFKLFEASIGEEINSFKAISFKAEPEIVTSLSFSPDGKYALFGSMDTIIRLCEISSGKQIRVFKGHTAPVMSVAYSPDGKRVVSGSEDGSVRLWDVLSGQEIAAFYHFNNGEWIVITPDNYYDSSPEGDPLIYWVLPSDMETFSFEQFESYLKRPDIIKARLSGVLDAGKPSPIVTHPPSIYMYDHMSFKKTKEKSYPLNLSVSFPEEVKTVRVFVNGKPTLEIPVGQGEKEIEIDVPLYSGANRVTAVAYDNKGFSSNPKYFDIICEKAGLVKPNLYVFAIGISEYPKLPSSLQLEFAHTDAQAIAKALQSQEGEMFGEVHYNVLTNGNATVKTVTEALDALNAVGENDIVVIFMAGHGVRDKDRTFFFLTSQGSFNEPQHGGLNWSLLGDYLSKMKGRVILFLDACHSGNIVTETVVPNDELAQEFFTGKRGGTMVFSASKGRQYSMESPDIGGGFGIFTYALTQGLGPKSKEADINGNDIVEFMELVEYVRDYVDKETKGKQTPWLSRKELFGDLPVAMVQ